MKLHAVLLMLNSQKNLNIIKMEKSTTINIKLNKKKFTVKINDNATVRDLKKEIARETGLRMDARALENLIINGKRPKSSTKLAVLNLKDVTTINLINDDKTNTPSTSREPLFKPVCTGTKKKKTKTIKTVQSTIEKSKRFMSKIKEHANQCSLKILNPVRPRKKLLVLDLDQTLIDIHNIEYTTNMTMRPFLYIFLKEIYRFYDIIIWSATEMDIIEHKLNLLALTSNPDYKIMALADQNVMMSLYLPVYGVLPLKPLSIIWHKFLPYNRTNTIMVDDVFSNMALNTLNALVVPAYQEKNYSTDRVLPRVLKYLINLAKYCTNFTKVNHDYWQAYEP